MKEVPLTNSELVALVDDGDYERISATRWRAHKAPGTTYALYSRYSRGRVGGHPIRDFSMHRVVMNAAAGQDVDHINGNGLDNRRSNLRIVSASENQQNRHRLTLNTSGYRGVTWNKQCGKWQAAIKRHGKSYHLGLHATKEDAARAYDEGAKRLYGPGARTNF